MFFTPVMILYGGFMTVLPDMTITRGEWSTADAGKKAINIVLILASVGIGLWLRMGSLRRLEVASSVPELTRAQQIYLRVLCSWLVVSVCAILAINWKVPVHRAVVGMGAGLVLFWVLIGGAVMWRFRDPICERVRRVPLDWRIKFVLFCTLLAMIEEAITTSMTNAAPLFGVHIGQAYMTASANYLDVIALHGVTLFVSFFVGWAVLLWRYDFSPFAVFVLFGITGTLIEMLYGGWPHVFEYAMWSTVYGLMVWLPARSLPRDRGATRPRWWLYPLAVFAPIPFVFLFPLLGVISLFFPHHPQVHFPPIR